MFIYCFAGHLFGSESEERIRAMKDLDDLLYYLDSQIESKNLTSIVTKNNNPILKFVSKNKLTTFTQVNTVVVSDHGMLTVDEDDSNITEIIDIDDIIDDEDVSLMLDRGSTSMLIPQLGKEDKVIMSIIKFIYHLLIIFNLRFSQI